MGRIPRGDGTAKPWSERLYSKYRRAWLQMKNIDVALFIGYPSNAPDEYGDRRFGADRIALYLKIYQHKIWLNLTTWTEEELLALRTILVTALDTAIPVARSIDQAAQSEMDAEMDDLSPRLFRMKPALFVRSMPEIKLASPDNNKENNGNLCAERAGAADDDPSF